MYKALTTLLSIILLLSITTAMAGIAPKLIHYQAVLEDAGGEPVTTETQVTFRIYDAATSKTILWEEARMVTPDEGGAFSIRLGETVPVNEDVFSAAERWLGITVGTDSELTPRTRLTSSPYSMRVETVDQAQAGTVKGPLTLAPSEGGSGDDAGLYVQNSVGENAFSMDAAADTPMFIVKGPGGDESVITSTGVTTPQLNVYAQTAKGGDDKDCSGPNLLGLNTQGNSAVGEGNDLSVAFNSFAVGECNTIEGDQSMTLGTDNVIGNSLGAFVVGSANRVEDNSDRCVIMGVLNYASGYENICHGSQDSIWGSNFSSILSGEKHKIISGYDNSIISGQGNRISGSAQSIICGGDSNRIDSLDNLEEFFLSASIGGGSHNIASSNYATISGGLDNEARGLGSTVGGGLENKATNSRSTVAGGRKNEALGVAATVGGGDSCIADGSYATVPGGGGNRAGGAYSFAAGIYANVDSVHDHCFVWNGDWDTVFFTTAPQQFLINAPGNVGINTNTPGYPLTVEGVTYSTDGVRYPDGNVQTEAYLGGATNGGWTDDGTNVRLTTINDNVGIGTITPTEKLHVVGAITSTPGSKQGGSILIDPEDFTVAIRPMPADTIPAGFFVWDADHTETRVRVGYQGIQVGRPMPPEMEVNGGIVVGPLPDKIPPQPDTPYVRIGYNGMSIGRVDPEQVDLDGIYIGPTTPDIGNTPLVHIGWNGMQIGRIDPMEADIPGIYVGPIADTLGDTPYVYIDPVQGIIINPTQADIGMEQGLIIVTPEGQWPTVLGPDGINWGAANPIEWYMNTGELTAAMDGSGLMFDNGDADITVELTSDTSNFGLTMTPGSRGYACTELGLGSLTLTDPLDSSIKIVYTPTGLRWPADTLCYVIPANAGWVPMSNGIDYTRNSHGLLSCQGSWTTHDTIEFYAEAHIPEGAHVIGLEAYVYDNSASEEIKFGYFWQTGTAPNEIGWVESSGATSAWHGISAVLDHVVVNDCHRSYYLVARLHQSANMFGNVKILYTMDVM